VPGRVTGLDAARALAILGMLAVNIGPRDEGGVTGKLLILPHGRASMLFVLLAGIGFTLLTRRAREGAPVPWQQVLWRALVLLLVGLSTQLLDHGLDVILTTYAMLFLVALAFVKAPSWLLLASTAAIVITGPLVWLAAQVAGPTFDRDPASLLDAPGEIVASTLLTGPYPVATWMAPFLFGMWLGRRRLRARRVQMRLILVGAAAAMTAEFGARALEAWLGMPDGAPGLDWLTSAAPHSQMPLWLIAATGAAAFVLGLTLLIEPHLGRLGWPLVATGQLALTVYVAHLFMIAWIVRPGPETAAGGMVATVALALALAVGSVGWRHFFIHGPLEALLRVRLHARSG